MEPLDHKFQQPEKDGEFKASQQRTFSIEEQTLNAIAHKKSIQTNQHRCQN
ncbi:MAG: hypothetical protein HC907_00305 [Richelia sp. SM1_7_0]|nr:hypothetical protein [Richelia sp. SM1_7_0]